jgi:hypothetical protein
VRAGVRLAKMLKGVAVETIEAVLGAEPPEPRRVLRNSQHGLLREACIDSEALKSHGSRRGGFPERAPSHKDQHGK